MYFASKSPQERNEWMEAFRLGRYLHHTVLKYSLFSFI